MKSLAMFINERNEDKISLTVNKDQFYEILNSIYSHRNNDDSLDKQAKLTLEGLFKLICDEGKKSGLELDPAYCDGNLKKCEL